MQIQVLRHRGFRDLWLGQAISQIGDALYYTSFMFMVRKFTGSDQAVGLMGAAEVLPFALMSGYAGVIVDRVDRRLVMVATDIFCATVLALLSLITFIAGKPLVPLLFVVAPMLALARVFFFPAKNAAIPRLLPEGEVTQGFAFSVGTQNLVMMLGTAISAGVLAQLWNLNELAFFHGVVLLNSASFLLSAVYAWRIPKIVPERDDAGEKTAHQEMREGVAFVLKRKDLVTLMLCTVTFSLGVSPFFVAYVASNEAWFGGRPETLAWNEFAFFVGMVSGTYLVAKYPPKRPGKAFTVAMSIVGIFVGAMAFCRNFPLFATMNLICGLAVPYADVPIRSYLQLTVPDGFRGRVNSIHNMLWTIMMPVGMVGLGSTIMQVGIERAFLIMGGVMTATFAIGILGRDFWNAKMPDASPQEEQDALEHALAEQPVAEIVPTG